MSLASRSVSFFSGSVSRSLYLLFIRGKNRRRILYFSRHCREWAATVTTKGRRESLVHGAREKKGGKRRVGMKGKVHEGVDGEGRKGKV